MSRCAAIIQQQELEHAPAALRDEITAKMCVRLPSQAPLVDAARRRTSSDPLHFVFVGAEFFRKGGKEVLAAFERLLDVRGDVRLTIVSRMAYGDYATNSTKQDQAAALATIERHPLEIRRYGQLPNAEVLRLLRDADVCLLPTYADTFGYSVLEAQAVGCPVVTTDVRALPEINDDESGWVIPLPLDARREAHRISAGSRERLSADLTQRLFETLRAIVDDPASITMRAQKSLERIRLHHSPARAAEQTEHMYDEAIAGAT
jgi:glycosyltransferase involved in cell wall biosynthesis